MEKTATLDPTDRYVTRALVEVIPNYTFTPHDGALIVESPEGNAYLVDLTAGTEGTCTCPAWEHGGQRGCKHTVAAAYLALQEGRDLDTERRARKLADLRAELTAEREAVRQRFEADFQRIFG